MKFFIYVIIVMAYIFNLFYVVTFMYNGGKLFPLPEPFKFASSFERVIVFVISFL